MQRISYLQTDVGILNDLLAYIRLDADGIRDTNRPEAPKFYADRIRAKCEKMKKILDSGDIVATP